MKAQFKKSTGFDAAKPSVGRRETVKITDVVELLEWPKKGKGVVVRFVGPIAGRGIHKIKVRKKDGNEVEIQKPCLAYRPDLDDKDSTVKCPYCKMPAELSKFSKLYFGNAIVRELQEDKPAKTKRPTKDEDATGFKEIDSETWTPVRVVRVPSSLMLRIRQLGEKNIVKSKAGIKKHFWANDIKHGFDLDITFDKSLPAASMYSADRTESPNGDKFSPLTEEEDSYLLWDTDQVYPAEEFEDAKRESKSLQDRWGGDDAKDDEDEDDEPKKKSAKKVVDEDDDEDDLDLDDDDDEEETPKKSAKKPLPKKSAKKVVDEDDEDLDLDDDDDEDDEEEPTKKPAKKTAKKVVDEDDDDDEDLDLDDDDDDDEEETPKKSAKKPLPKKSTKKVVDDDEDDEDEDDDEDDEDDEDETPKKSAKKPLPKKTAKKVVDEDEDDDEDDLDEDEDEEEEEEPPKKSAKKPLAKRSSR